MTTTLDRLANMEREEDLEEYWADLRPQKLVEVVRQRGSDLDSMLKLAAEQTIFDLALAIREKYSGSQTTPEVMADIVATGVRLFMQKWRESLTNQNLTGLIEIVLEGQHLSTEEMQGFVRALPISLLQRIAASVMGSATGTHALMSLEFLRRQGGVSYTLGSTGTRIWAEFSHPKTNEKVHFYLDENFKLPDG